MRSVLVRLPLHHIGLPDVPIYGYGFMLMIAFLAGVALARRLARREQLPSAAIFDIAFVAVAAGVVGARIMWILRFAPEDTALHEYIEVWRGGLVFYGGLLGALGCCLLYVWRTRLPPARTADVFAPAVMLGLGFGRIGCFLNGCCFGAVVEGGAWYAVRFPAGSPAAVYHHGPELGRELASFPVYPAQLMAGLAGFLICGVLLLLYRHRRFPGQITLAMLMLYSAGRFTLEFFRDDTAPRVLFTGLPPLKEGQIMGVLTFVVAAVLMIVFWKRSASQQATTDAPAAEADAAAPGAGGEEATHEG